MTETMMALGPYRFAASSAAYQSLRRSSEYRWPVQERLGSRPARQFVGVGNESINLVGVLYPHLPGGLLQLERMREVAGQGQPLRLTDGRGKDWGRWVIESIEETQAVFFADGTPRKIEFALQLAAYGEDA
ncbi:phage tail protein [Geoalkalibacter halelectricus]|uniref:phage tail protein n=1 Tax=Geoalkalibacter halelectricus TaxID=2847045 RepID=UPI003D1FB732